MIKKFFYIIIGVAGALLSGCSNELQQPETEDGPVPILLSVSGTRVSAEAGMTRGDAVSTDFPNNGNMAVMAAKTRQGATTFDWSADNLHLNHVAATAGTKSNGNYPVALTPVQYWSFDANEYLSFAAYSPSTAKKEGAGPGLLTVRAGASAPFPDLLYSTPTGSYNKETGKDGVELTTFRHAMARLVIQVVPVDKNGQQLTDYKNDELNISKLAIQTKVTSGDFDFLAATPAWTLTAPGTDAGHTTLYTLISAATAKALPYDSSDSSQGGSNKGYYLLPATNTVNTVALSKIDFELKDKAYTYTYASGDDGSLDEFKTADSGSVTLEIGKTTVLTIKVKVTDIEHGGGENVILFGTLKDWEYKGNSTVTIN